MLRPVILAAAILAGFSTQSLAAYLTVSITGANPSPVSGRSDASTARTVLRVCSKSPATGQATTGSATQVPLPSRRRRIAGFGPSLRPLLQDFFDSETVLEVDQAGSVKKSMHPVLLRILRQAPAIL